MLPPHSTILPVRRTRVSLSACHRDHGQTNDEAAVGIDLGETSCSLVGVDTAGEVLVRRRMRRDTVVAFCSKYPGSVVAVEACCGAHHIGRTLSAKGHEMRPMSSEDVRP